MVSTQTCWKTQTKIMLHIIWTELNTIASSTFALYIWYLNDTLYCTLMKI